MENTDHCPATRFLFDPEDQWISPRLQGFRLHEGEYVPLLPDDAGRRLSQELGLLLEAEEILLRLVDLRTGQQLMTFEETQEAYEQARQQAQQARREAEAKRQRIAALEVEVARLRGAANPPDQTP